MSNEVVKSQKGAGINWNTTIFLVIFHLGAIGALFTFSWTALFVSLALWWISASLGVGIGFHRLLTHRGFKTPKFIEYFLTFCGTLALQGGPIYWITTHRIHHAFTDAPGDPHSPREGRWWSHMGWMVTGTAQQYDKETMRRYAPDLMNDRFHSFINKVWWIPIIISAVLLFTFGGWTFLFWCVFLRITAQFHFTWLVNSATHMWGSRRFETHDDSTNNWWVAILTFGEGWHNNHHAHPRAARHGVAWYEVDTNWWTIRTMKMLGLAKSIKLIRKSPRNSVTNPATKELAEAPAMV
jgi:stearoyl-CoA desaturase (delta-9 desaturase)